MTGEHPKKDLGRKEYEYLCDITEAIEEIETHPRFAEGKVSASEAGLVAQAFEMQKSKLAVYAEHIFEENFTEDAHRFGVTLHL